MSTIAKTPLRFRLAATRLWSVVIASAFLPAVLLAQTAGTGAIRGRVFNPAIGQYVTNAEVRLAGTNQVTYTENDGTFQFAGVAAGEASVTVTYSGYETIRDTFRVTAAETAVRDINLTSTAAGPAATKAGDVLQLSAFTVSSEREGNSKAVAAQRRNMDISTSVSSDIFGDVADGNVGEFLKYLPGVDLDYVESLARGPRLGGMDSQYVGVAFDGMRFVFMLIVPAGESASDSALVVRLISIDSTAVIAKPSKLVDREFSPPPRTESALAILMPSKATPTYCESMPPSRGPRASDST